jgi:hypothetical protein
MAVCPKCGSSHISLTRETNINWGRAIVGWAAFGVVGGAVAGVTGEDRNAVACLDCGASWRPADVFNVIQAVKDATGSTLDLSLEIHRVYLDRFISELSPYIDSEVIKAKEMANKIILEGKNGSLGPGARNGCFSGIISSLIILFGTGYIRSHFLPSNVDLWSLVLGLTLVCATFVACMVMGFVYDEKRGWSANEVIKKSEEEAAAVIAKAKENVVEQIRLFTKKYPLHRPPLPPPPRLQ